MDQIRGKGEGIRRALYYSKIPFIDVRLDRATFMKMKESGELPFGQLPALRTADGKHLLAQSAAIYRYIGKISSLYPEDLIEAAKVDALMDQEADMFVGLTVSTYTSRFGFGFLAEDPSKIPIIRKSINDEVLPRHLTNIERSVVTTEGPWLGGQAHPSIADFAMVYRLKSLKAGKYEGIDTSILDGYPNICGMIKAFDALSVADVEF